MAPDTDCSTPSILSRNVTITYGAVYALFLVVVSVYSFKFLVKYNIKFIKSSKSKKLKIWVLDAWRRRRCYVPIVAHIFDQVTDVSVALQFYILGTTKSNGGEWNDCSGLNMWYLFILTVLSMAIYRLVSSYLIYMSTKSIKRFISQMLDLELLHTLYINYLCDKTEPCNPQRWITTLEAALESSPQVLIQFIYLVRTNTFTTSYLVVISLTSSLISIISKLVSDDKTIVIAQAQKMNFAGAYNMFIDILIVILYIIISAVLIVLSVISGALWIPFLCFCFPCCGIIIAWSGSVSEGGSELFQMIKSSFHFNSVFTIKDILKLNERFKWNSKPIFYILRFIWRILDISSVILLMTLIWIVVGGLALTIKVAFEFIMLLLVCIITKKWELLFAIIATVISTTTNRLKTISVIIGIYRIASNIVLIILVSVWLYVDFECSKCTDYVDRKMFAADSTVFTVFVYTWISVVTSPICVSLLLYYNVFEANISTSRNLEEMIIAKNNDGIIEMQLYAGKYGVYDETNGRTLLMLAMKQRNVAVVSHLLSKSDKYDDKDEKGLNILDYYMEYIGLLNDETISKKKMANNLVKIFEKHPEMKSKQKYTPFLCSCYHGELECVETLIDLDENVLNDITEQGQNGATLAKYNNHNVVVEYLEKTHNIKPTDINIDQVMQNKILTSALPKIYQKDPDVVSSDGYTAFLCACHHGDLEVVRKLMDMNKIVLREKRGNDNAVDIARKQNHTEIVDYLRKNGIDDNYNELQSNLILLGSGNSGKSTLFQQIQAIHGNGLSEDPDRFKKKLLFYSQTTGVISQKFTIQKNKYQIVDVGGMKAERKRWICCYDDVTAVIFVASLSCYDEEMYEAEGVNCMVDQLELFDTVVNDTKLKNKAMILLLNKKDLLSDKLSQNNPITLCPAFQDYQGDQTSLDETTTYIKNMFLKKNNLAYNKPIHTYLICAIHQRDVETMFEHVQDIITSNI